MAPDSYSFLRLTELIQAKIARRLELQAEIASIGAELAEAHRALSEIPSLAALPGVGHPPQLPAAVHVATPTATTDRPKQVHLQRSLICQECQEPFLGRAGKKYCDNCVKVVRGRKMRQAWIDGRFSTRVKKPLAAVVAGVSALLLTA